MSGSANGQVLDHYLSTQFEVIRIVHDNLDSIRSVASHLTPVEDLVDFREEVEALYAKLGLLTTASELIFSATPSGIALLTAVNAAAQRTLLELKSAAMREEGYFATATGLAAAVAAITTTDNQVTALLTELAGKASNTDLQTLKDRVDLRFGGTAVDLLTLENRIILTQDGLDTSLAGVTTTVNGLTTRVTQNETGTTLALGRVTLLETGLQNLNTGAAASTTAIQNLTSVTGVQGDLLFTQGQLITGLDSRLVGAENATAGTATALQTLTTEVSDNGIEQTILASSVNALDVRLVNTEFDLVATGTAIDTLSTSIEQNAGGLTILSEDVTALTASITGGGNQLANAAFESDLRDWELFSRGVGWEASQLQRDLDSVLLPQGIHALSVTTAGVPLGTAGIRGTNIPVEALSTHILSGYLAAVNCTVKLEWRILNGLGVEIGFGIAGSTIIGPGVNLQSWPRVSGLIQVPVDGAHIQIQVWVTNSHTAAPKAWLIRPMLEEVAGAQTLPSPWSAGTAGIEQAAATANQTLQAAVTLLGGDVEAMSSASTELNARVGTVEGALINEMITSANKNSALVATSNELVARMASTEGVANTAGSAVQTLAVDLEALNGTVSAHTSDLTTLHAQVDAIDEGTGGSGAAIAALDTRVDQTELDIISQGNSIISLQNSVTSANKVFVQDTPPATAGRTDGDLWIQPSGGNKFHTLTGGVWIARPDNSKNRVFVQDVQPTAGAINDLWVETDNNNKLWRWNGTTWLDISDARTTANSTAVASLNTLTGSQGGLISSQGTAITTLEGTVNNGTTGVVATAGALSSLNTLVTSNNTAQSSAVTAVNARVDTTNTNLASARSELSTSVEAVAGRAATLEAKWNVTLDVNGYVTGVTSVNNGVVGTFTILADNFRIVTPGAAAFVPFEIIGGVTYIKNAVIQGVTVNKLLTGTLNADMLAGTGRIIFDNGAVMKVTGIGFGSTNQFIEWFGPKMAISACTEANAIQYLKTNGSAYFGGSLSAGLLRNAATSTQVSNLASVSTGVFGTNGGAKTVVCSLAYTNGGVVPGNQKSTYNGVINRSTVTLQRRYAGGAWVTIGTINAVGTTVAEYDMEMGETTVDTPISGTITVTDTQTGTGTFEYQATCSAPAGYFTSAFASNGANPYGNQSLTIVSTEG